MAMPNRVICHVILKKVLEAGAIWRAEGNAINLYSKAIGASVPIILSVIVIVVLPTFRKVY